MTCECKEATHATCCNTVGVICCCIPACCPDCQCHLTCESKDAADCWDPFCYVHERDE